MKWGVTGFLIVFGALILLMIINPNLSCFGKRLKSPFYPLLRKRKRTPGGPARTIKTTDYGFRLGDETPPARKETSPQAQKKAEDYGFKLD
jgi:hypothetical protein